MTTGKIGVSTKDLFPIIKKFLYSDHDIFLREIVSNAVDATQKLKVLASSGEYSGELGEVKIRVKADKEAGTLTVSDRGIGMTRDEVEKYINQIAFSGAEEFLEKHKDDAATIIGHFGLGFYSAFMVSSRVDIVTRSYKEGAQAVKWSCNLKEEDYLNFYHQLYPMAEDPLFHIHLNVDYPFNLTGILYFPKINNKFEIQKNKIQLYSNQVYVTDSVEGIVPEYLTLLHGVIDSPDIPLNVSRSYLQSDRNVKKISNHITKKVADSLSDIFTNNRVDYEKKWDDLKVFIQYGMLTDEKFAERADSIFLFKDTDGKYFTFEEYDNLVNTNQTDKDKNLVSLYATDATEQFSYIERAKAKGYNVLLMDGQLDTHFINYLEQKHTDHKYLRVDADVLEKLIQKEDVRKTELSEAEQEELRPVFTSQLPKDNGMFFVNFEALGEDGDPVVVTRSEFMRRMKEMAAMNPGMGFYGAMGDQYTLVVNTDHKLVKGVLESERHEMTSKLEPINFEICEIEGKKTELEELNKGRKDEEIPQVDKDRLKEFNEKLDSMRKQKESLLEEYGKENKIVGQLIDLALLANGLLKGEALNNFVKRSVELINTELVPGSVFFVVRDVRRVRRETIFYRISAPNWCW